MLTHGTPSGSAEVGKGARRPGEELNQDVDRDLQLVAANHLPSGVRRLSPSRSWKRKEPAAPTKWMLRTESAVADEVTNSEKSPIKGESSPPSARAKENT